MASTPHVLVVDDEESILEFVSWALAEEGYEVTCAPHGGAALEMLDRIRPDLILLDLRMPVLDGLAFLQAYREKGIPQAPVVVLTAGSRWPNSVEGAAGFLAKPFDLADLLTVVEQHTAPTTFDVGNARRKP